MIKQLLYKWFGLQDEPCETCEILREQLAKSDSERKDLLARLLNPPVSEPPQKDEEEMKPVQPAFVPWRIRQQMMEAEDRKQADLLRNRQREIAQLEKDLGIGAKDASNIRETVPIHANDSARQEEIHQGSGAN